MSLTFAPETIEIFSQTGIGQVEQTITLHQQGRVKFMATTWFARFYDPDGAIAGANKGIQKALPGTPVRVIGREGLTLLVMTVEDWNYLSRLKTEASARNQMNLWGWLDEIGSWLVR